MAVERGPVADDTALKVVAETSFAEVTAPDVIVVPGGLITRKLARDRDPIVEWIASAHEHTTYTTSVCTGALLLGAAGLLEGLDATTHWCAYEQLRGYGARPTEQRVVWQGKIATGAGVSAGIDLAFSVVAALYGPEMAQAVQLGIEYDPQPPFDAGSPASAPPEVYEVLSDAMRRAEAQLLA